MKRINKNLLCGMASIMLLFAFACTPPEDDPVKTPVKNPDDHHPEQTVQLVRKWVYVGKEIGSSYEYDEQNRIELYSDSTYICYWRGDEQRGTYSIDTGAAPRN